MPFPTVAIARDRVPLRGRSPSTSAPPAQLPAQLQLNFQSTLAHYVRLARHHPPKPDSGPVVPCVSFPRLTCELARGGG